MEPATGSDAVAAEALAQIYRVEADAEAIVVQARTEAKALVDRARREMEDRHTTQEALARREAQAHVEELLATTRREIEAKKGAARDEVARHEAALKEKLPTFTDEIVALVLGS